MAPQVKLSKKKLYAGQKFFRKPPQLFHPDLHQPSSTMLNVPSAGNGQRLLFLPMASGLFIAKAV